MSAAAASCRDESKDCDLSQSTLPFGNSGDLESSVLAFADPFAVPPIGSAHNRHTEHDVTGGSLACRHTSIPLASAVRDAALPGWAPSHRRRCTMILWTNHNSVNSFANSTRLIEFSHSPVLSSERLFLD